MRAKLRIACAVFGAPLALILSSGVPLAATTLTVNSQGAAVLSVLNFPMADGSTAQTFTTKYVEMGIDGDFKGQTWGGECAGSGVVSAEGVYSGQYLCTTTLNADDAFTISVTDKAEGADWVVTGGKGKFKGATGKGHTAYTWGDAVFGDKITIAAEGTIILP